MRFIWDLMKFTNYTTMSKIIFEQKQMIKLVVMCITSILLAFLFCYRYFETPQASKNTYHKKIQEKINKMRESITDKKLHSISEIVGKINKSKVLLLYTGYDCHECLKESFNYMRDIKSSNKIEVCVIASESNIGADKIHYDYDGVIWSDPKNEIRKELNYILTPAFLMLDSRDTVRLASWLLPTNQEENKEEFTKI